MHAFHPYHQFGILDAILSEDNDNFLSHALFGQDDFKHKVRTEETEENHVIRMEIPGVKAERITIEENDGEVEITAVRVGLDGQVNKIYQEIFYLKPNTSDFSNAKATIHNGILTITVPKKHVNQEVEVESTLPADSFDPSASHYFTVDLPGVDASRIKVLIRDGHIQLKAERKVMGGSTIEIVRKFEVPSSVNLNESRAFLQDGVFTFIVPTVQNNDMEEDDQKKTSATRFIYVEDEQSASEIEHSIEGMKLNDEVEEEMESSNNNNVSSLEDTKEEEQGKEQEWEQVSGD